MTDSETIGIRDKAFVVDTDDGRASWTDGSLVQDRVIGKCTDGAYSVVEHSVPPDYTSSYHINHGEKEIRYLLDGAIEIVTEGDTFPATAGQTVVFKQGQPHGWRVTSDGPARMLVLCSPAGVEEFYHEAGRPAERREIPENTQRRRDELRDRAADYDIEILAVRPPSR